jgi:capsule polysaccharide export protein KpsE/RkpR
MNFDLSLLPQLSPDLYIHEVQIKKLKQRNKAMASRMDFLQENQEAMSKQIKVLKKEVAANNAKAKKP